MNAIPTMYAGVQFRSRLEARWAAFFDLLAWRWEYEPIDLNGYIPDFILNFPEPILVEVKPFLDLADPVIDDAKYKIRKSGWPLLKRPPLDELSQRWRREQEEIERCRADLANKERGERLPSFLGDLIPHEAHLPRPQSFESWLEGTEHEYILESIVVGAYLPPGHEYACEPDVVRVGTDYRFHFRDCKCGIGLIDVEGSFACKRCGQYDGGHTPLARKGVVVPLWREAGNRVQWRSPR